MYPPPRSDSDLAATFYDFKAPDAIMLQVNNLSQPGSYDLSEIPNTAFVNLPDGTQIGALSGSIVITQLSGNKAKGTFSGSFYDITDLMQTPNYTVTEGSFEASF